ncbi:MAG TPA: hypothetical protein VID73_11415 [Ktedonobacterales bacterium]
MRRPGAGGLILIVMLAAGYFVARGPMWNADSRIFLTASIVDRGRLDIDPFASGTGDIAAYHGHFFSDKAPGTSLFAIPAYLVLKYTLLGGKPYAAIMAAPPDQRVDFFPRYLLALLFSALPTGVVAALLRAVYLRLGVRRLWADGLALTYGLGTIALPFARVFFGHQLAAALVFGAFVVLLRVRLGELAPRYVAAAGALAGCAIITEYPAALLVALLVAYAANTSADRRRVLAALALGAAPALLVGALYNTLAFGGPLSQGYAHLAATSAFRAGQAQGFMGITRPHLEAIWQTTFGPYRGMFLLSPVLLLAVPGFVWLRRRPEWRAEWWLWLAAVVGYALFTVSYFEWDGGFSIGSRHFLPALPFLMLPLAELTRPERRRAWRVALVALAGASVVIVGLANAVGPLFDPVYRSPLSDLVLPSLVGRAPGAPASALSPLRAQLDNNWGMVLRLPGVVQLVPLWGAIALVAGRRWQRLRQTEPSGA